MHWVWWNLIDVIAIQNPKERDVQLRIKNQPSLQTAKDEENVG
jgi:hypothetical protein